MSYTSILPRREDGQEQIKNIDSFALGEVERAGLCREQLIMISFKRVCGFDSVLPFPIVNYSLAN